MPKLLIVPSFDTVDKGDGGIRRVVEAQKKYLPEHGFEILSTQGLDPRIVAEQADIISVHGGAWVDASVPIVSHSHGLYWQEYEWPTWAHDLNKEVVEAARKADVVTSPSKWVSRVFARGLSIDSPVLYHGIEPKDWKAGNKEDAFVLWNKTRLDPICDVEPLGVLARMAPDIKFVSTFSPSSPVANITTTGRLNYERAKGFIQDSSVYFCNTRETFGIGTLEAMASETPVLGWDWGGQREIVEHKVTGWLARPGDYDSLHEGLAYCIANRAKMGKAARQHVLKNFTWRSAIKRYAELYDNVLKSWQQHKLAPRVSVIITCYNLAELLPRAVASIQRQTSSDWEIVIVNDASPDNTSAIADRLAAVDERIKVVTNETNLYLAGSLNAGIAASRGKFIVPLDADNELGDNALEVLGDHLDAHRETDIVYGKMQVIEEGKPTFISDWPPKEFDYFSQISKRNQISSTAMYRKSVWERVGGYRRRCRTAEDADFWCRTTTFGARPEHVTDAVTLIYHNRSDSMSHVEKEWNWNAWYPWKSGEEPFGASREWPKETKIASYEPVKITVIIPVGPGHEEVVLDALDSLVGQTYTQWNAIVVNDSGTKIPWLHPFVTVLDTGGGKGPAVARNMGIAASTTPLFLPLDADDFLQPEALEALYKAWQPGTYVYCDWIAHKSDGTQELKQSFDFDCKQILQKLPHAVTALYERAAWEKVGGFDEKISAWEDWDFVIALAASGQCGTRLAQPLFHYRMDLGTRREKHYAGKEEYKLEIAEKWSRYIKDGEPMACGGCGKNRAVFAPKSSNGSALASNNGVSGSGTSEAILLEYMGTGGARSYRGEKTGTIYRFGSNPEHKFGYVRGPDVPSFKLKPEFRESNQVVAEKPLLAAAGPPKRTKANDGVSGQNGGAGDADNVSVKRGEKVAVA